MVHFVGAGSGAPDLITLRGARLLGEADVVIYAGSLVNPELLTLTKPGCEVHDSAKLTLEEVIALIERAERPKLLPFSVSEARHKLVAIRALYTVPIIGVQI